MNINDIKTEAPTGVDMLQAIFDRQLELEKKYDHIERANGFANMGLGVDLDSPAAQWFIKDGAYRVVEELSEATNTLKNKPWKTTHVSTDQMHYFEELIDALHFMVRLFLISGLSAEAVYRLYFKKSEVNKFRQASDY